MKLVITGGSGILGRDMLSFIPKEWDVILLTRKKLHGVIPRNKTENVRVLFSDFNKLTLTDQFKGADAVIHLAASRRNEHWFDNVNLDASVFEACFELGIENVVYTSSRSVYGFGEICFTENMPLSPINDYARGKAISERLICVLNAAGMRIKALRLAQIMSEFESLDSAIGTFIHAGLTGQPVNVTASDNEIREYIVSKDAAKAIIHTVSFNKVSGIFNLGSGWALSLREYAEIISKCSTAKPQVFFAPSSFETKKSIMNSDLFKRTFNYDLNFTIHDSIKQLYGTQYSN